MIRYGGTIPEAAVSHLSPSTHHPPFLHPPEHPPPIHNFRLDSLTVCRGSVPWWAELDQARPWQYGYNANAHRDQLIIMKVTIQTSTNSSRELTTFISGFQLISIQHQHYQFPFSYRAPSETPGVIPPRPSPERARPPSGGSRHSGSQHVVALNHPRPLGATAGWILQFHCVSNGAAELTSDAA